MNKKLCYIIVLLVFSACDKKTGVKPPVVPPVTPAPAFSILAGSGIQGSADGKGIGASFFYSVALAVDQSGNILVADSYNNKIRKIAPDGTVTTIAGTGVKGNTDGPALQATFYTPHDLLVDHSGNIYVIDLAAVTGHGQNIRKISTSGNVTTIPVIYNGQPLNRDYNVFTMDVAGNIFLADSEDYDLKKLSPSGVVTSIEFNGPANIDGFAFDNSGNLFMADNENTRILKLKPDGTVSVFCKTFLQTTNGVDSQADFVSPGSMVIDKAGNLFMEDFGAIRKITPNGVATTAILNAYPENNGDNFVHTNLMDASGNLYVPERLGNKILKITFRH